MSGHSSKFEGRVKVSVTKVALEAWRDCTSLGQAGGMDPRFSCATCPASKIVCTKWLGPINSDVASTLLEALNLLEAAYEGIPQCVICGDECNSGCDNHSPRREIGVFLDRMKKETQ
jgi:hypothetical protein